MWFDIVTCIVSHYDFSLFWGQIVYFQYVTRVNRFNHYIIGHISYIAS